MEKTEERYTIRDASRDTKQALKLLIAVHDNYQDLQPSDKELFEKAIEAVREILGADRNGDVPVANIVHSIKASMKKKGTSYSDVPTIRPNTMKPGFSIPQKPEGDE